MKIDKETVEQFAKIFIEQIKLSDSAFKEFNLLKANYLPNAFSGKSAIVNGFYSSDREHILIVFFKSDEYRYKHWEIVGNVFDAFDVLRLWRPGAGIRVENSNMSMRSHFITGGRPIDLYGTTEMIIEDLKMVIPYPQNLVINLDFVLVFSKDIFLEKFNRLQEYASKIALNYIDFFQTTGKKYQPGSKDSTHRNKELHELKLKMEDHFFNSRYRETKIDNFIGENPVILKYGLGLINGISPMVLKDIHGQYNQDLKPDLVGYNSVENQWEIVDYKLPLKKLMRGTGTVRASVTSDVTQLHSQLKTYREYFLDHSQREHVNTTYNIDIKRHPPAIGVIGTVSEDERDDFNEMRQEYPAWFKVMSYDELYKKVCEYIEVVSKID
ncbi:DUF4263 domain-containing protein [Neobacillus niacini]|uniref:DUF4263 domain-containing protein n=1 Tax=Neobacillus niacini TaxID=86668 RepID=UPI0021CB1388|nr:DUF4263 domain-containing protein [Neobacillus niacini]